MLQKIDLIIDFEFTGLDNTFIRNNEIIQMKLLNTSSGQTTCVDFWSKKNITAHPFLSHKKKKMVSKFLFHRDRFWNIISKAAGTTSLDKILFHGFGTTADMAMLKKYDIDIHINDIRSGLQLTKFEKRMATEGSGLEATYCICTGKSPELHHHDGEDELKVIHRLYLINKKQRHKKFLTVMPHGHCAGMPISRYTDEHRRQADGYRFNNSDLLSKSLSHEIEQYENFSH